MQVKRKNNSIKHKKNSKNKLKKPNKVNSKKKYQKKHHSQQKKGRKKVSIKKTNSTKKNKNTKQKKMIGGDRLEEHISDPGAHGATRSNSASSVSENPSLNYSLHNVICTDAPSCQAAVTSIKQKYSN